MTEFTKMMTPGDILRFYPYLKKRWTAGDIGYLLRLGLVRGKRNAHTCYLYPEDVIKIFTTFPSKK